MKVHKMEKSRRSFFSKQCRRISEFDSVRCSILMLLKRLMFSLGLECGLLHIVKVFTKSDKWVKKDRVLNTYISSKADRESPLERDTEQIKRFY